MTSVAAPIRTLAGVAERVVLICGKCGKKLGGGFGAAKDRALAKALRHGVAGVGGKRDAVRIVETKCLDVCPKGAVVVIDASHPREILIVARGTPVEDVASRLGLIGPTSSTRGQG